MQLAIKALHIRPDPSLSAQECMLKVSLQPLRLNVDQVSVVCSTSFFENSWSNCFSCLNFLIVFTGNVSFVIVLMLQTWQIRFLCFVKFMLIEMLNYSCM